MIKTISLIEQNPEISLYYMIASCASFVAMNYLVKDICHEINVLQILFFMHFFRTLTNTLIIKLAKIPVYQSIQNEQAFKLLSVRAFIGSIYILFGFYAVTLISLSDSTTLIQTNPIWGILLAGYYLKEKITKKTIISSLISFLGIIFIVKPQFIITLFQKNENPLQEHQKITQFYGIILSLLASIGIASIMIIMRQLTQYKVHNAIQLQYMSVSGIILTGITILILKQYYKEEIIDNKIYEFQCLIKLLLIGILAWFGQFFQSRALVFGKVKNVAIFQYFQVLFAFLVDVITNPTDIEGTSVIGSIMIISSSIYCIINK